MSDGHMEMKLKIFIIFLWHTYNKRWSIIQMFLIKKYTKAQQRIHKRIISFWLQFRLSLSGFFNNIWFH